MSRQLLDLGARLRAATDSQPVALAAYAPALPPTAPVAVALDPDGHSLRATDGTTTTSGTGRQALIALDDLGITLDAPTYRTLVITSPAALSALTTLARTYPSAACAPVIAWWDQRADHPGTGAVHAVIATARQRWVLGVAPDRERDLDTWLTWLGITSTGPQALLDLARASTAGSTLPGLLDAAGADTRAWERHQQRIAAGRPWLAPDNRADAALGLASRSHATEHYASLRLDDPLVAHAATTDGTVVTGHLTHHDTASITVRAARPLSRLRVGSEVTGWIGAALDAHAGPAYVTGRVLTATVGTDAALTLTVGDFAKRPAQHPAGTMLTLRPRRVDPFMQANGRRLMAGNFHRSGNWLAGRGRPVLTRSDVPLDVVVAAADPD
ncbi:hypothetical protein [uncultured Cellulomonas sp.]|uniref:hypothetical protein n=1 Tax=uncultured Cellulomonas sp. TaxID=189682 RepID=UPI00261074EA|nr:hypothetical protein [uncultured Cellulomonas sp.]